MWPGGEQGEIGMNATLTRGAVTRVMLTDYRCYASARLDCDGGPVVLTGPNGAGKTNLLEALSFLAPGRGLRRAPLAEITRRPADDGDTPSRWAVAARVATPHGECSIGTGLDPESPEGVMRRVVRVDGRPLRSQTELAPLVAVVWLTPQMDRLFLESASGRRRFLDRLVFGLHGEHATHVAAYERAMRERTRLLRDERERGRAADPAWLTALEEVMAANGVAVAAARRDLVARLGAAGPARDGSFPAAGIAVRGPVEDWLEDEPAVAVEARLRECLAAGRAKDAAAGGAGPGPHRSDLSVRHIGKGQPAALCSTGEQKALLIGIVLAHARLLAAERGSTPLVLLDEVAAHLDARRRGALFEEILALGAQAWLTGTDHELFVGLSGRANHFSIEDAHLSEGTLMKDARHG